MWLTGGVNRQSKKCTTDYTSHYIFSLAIMDSASNARAFHPPRTINPELSIHAETKEDM